MKEILENLPSWATSPFARSIGVALLVLLVIFVIVRVVQRVVSRQIHDSSMRYRVRRAIGLFGYAAAVISLVSLFDNDLGRLTLVLGGIGAGVAFALQEIIASLAGWLSLTFGGIYGIGDRIQIAGIRGDVVAVSPLRTTLVELGGWVDGDLYNGRIARISNAFVFKEPVFNYSADFSFLWDEIRVPIRSDSDRGLAEQIFQDALEEVTREATERAKEEWAAMQDRYAVEDASLEPAIAMTFDENWQDYRLRFVVDAKVRRSTKRRLSSAVLDRIEATGGAVQVATTSTEISRGSEILISQVPVAAA